MVLHAHMFVQMNLSMQKPESLERIKGFEHSPTNLAGLGVSFINIYLDNMGCGRYRITQVGQAVTFISM